MNEYKKKLAAMQAGQQNTESPKAQMTNGIPNSALLSVFEGKTHATGEMMGHKQNLAPSIAAKMSQAFGIDLTGMQVYRSDAMVGTGMHGMAQGNKVVLSSDVDLNTTEGQAVLGHELSHINAQRQGIGAGHSGLYDNAALEHQADVEGMRAAHGRPIYSSGMEYSDGMKYGLGMRGVEGLAPMSSGLGAAAAAPMQADKSFGPEAARKKLNARLTEQLAAYGIKVVDEDVSKPQNAAPEMQKGRQLDLPSSTSFSTPTLGDFPTSPVVNDPDHKLLPSKEDIYGGSTTNRGWFSNSPIFNQDTKWPSKEAVLGGGKTTSGTLEKFFDINHVSPEQMQMGKGKTTSVKSKDKKKKKPVFIDINKL